MTDVTASQPAMSDVDKLGEIVHHALWPGAPRSMYPHLTKADRARYRSVAAAVVDALGLAEEWRTTGWLGPVAESMARNQAETEGTLQRRLVTTWAAAPEHDTCDVGPLDEYQGQ